MGAAAWSAAAQAAVGIGTAVVANSQANEQEEYMQSLVNQGQGNRDLIEGIDRYFLGGGRAVDYDIPGFSEQFGQLDNTTKELISKVDDDMWFGQQQIEDTMPAGGSKLRALAELSIKGQDVKAQIRREYEAKKNDLDVNLTNSYLQKAMGRQGGVDYNTQYSMGMQGLLSSQNMMAGIGSSLGRLAGSFGKDDDDKPTMEMSPKSGLAPTPYSARNTLDPDGWDLADDWITDGRPDWNPNAA
jgi:hypothetical protein